jgi:hypothetical protein
VLWHYKWFEFLLWKPIFLSCKLWSVFGHSVKTKILLEYFRVTAKKENRRTEWLKIYFFDEFGFDASRETRYTRVYIHIFLRIKTKPNYSKFSEQLFLMFHGNTLNVPFEEMKVKSKNTHLKYMLYLSFQRRERFPK